VNIKIPKIILQKLELVPKEYLHQSRKKLREVAEKIKELNIENNEVKRKSNILAKENLKLQSQKAEFSKQKLFNWAQKVKKDGVCDICNESDMPMTAHHVWAKSIHPTMAYERANGVCLCLDCHNKYHKKYHHIEDCNQFTYNEFKEDEQNKFRLTALENEVDLLKSKGFKVPSFIKKFKGLK